MKVVDYFSAYTGITRALYNTCFFAKPLRCQANTRAYHLSSIFYISKDHTSEIWNGTPYMNSPKMTQLKPHEIQDL